jgi:hypothetical protein
MIMAADWNRQKSLYFQNPKPLQNFFTKKFTKIPAHSWPLECGRSSRSKACASRGSGNQSCSSAFCEVLPRARTITHVSLVQWSARRALYGGIFCMQSAPINVPKKSNFTCTVPPIRLPGPALESQICACHSVLGDYSKKTREGLFHL